MEARRKTKNERLAYLELIPKHWEYSRISDTLHSNGPKAYPSLDLLRLRRMWTDTNVLVEE